MSLEMTNVSDLVDAAVAADDKLTKTQAKAIIDGVFKSISDAAVKGEEVSIPGFGKFKVQAKPARTGRNPATGATIEGRLHAGQATEGRRQRLTSAWRRTLKVSASRRCYSRATLCSVPLSRVKTI
jgi:DNA-binding protein HU-beta